MKALITDMRHASAKEEERVLTKAGIELDTTFCGGEEDLIRNGKGAVGFLVSYANITRRVMEALPELKVIVKYGIGVDTIDLKAATDLGKFVVNVPDYCTEEVAVHALSLILNGLRMVPKYSAQVREGVWTSDPEGVIIYRPSEVRFGLAGYGRIAQRLAFLARPLFKEILFYDPYVDSAKLDDFPLRKVCSLEELFGQCSAVSIHTPLTQLTKGTVGKLVISRGKGVVLVNTGRGGVVEEDAVREGLAKGWLSFFGADVYWQEPPLFQEERTRELLSDPRVCITPHVAWCSAESAREVRIRASEEVVRAARGELPINIVNKEVLKSRS